jgi:ferredoxin--NADP+ reductase
VTGWIRRGPSGVIGTNKKDGQEAAGSVLADAEAGVLNAPPRDDDILELLEERGAEPVDWEGWGRIDEQEVKAGEESGRPRVKLARYEELLGAARGEKTPG